MTSTTAAPPAPAAVPPRTTATDAAFIGSGFAFASWAARIPQVHDRLDLDPAALGLVLAIAVYLPKSASVLVKPRHGHRDWSVHLSPSDRYR